MQHFIAPPNFDLEATFCFSKAFRQPGNDSCTHRLTHCLSYNLLYHLRHHLAHIFAKTSLTTSFVASILSPLLDKLPLELRDHVLTFEHPIFRRRTSQSRHHSSNLPSVQVLNVLCCYRASQLSTRIQSFQAFARASRSTPACYRHASRSIKKHSPSSTICNILALPKLYDLTGDDGISLIQRQNVRRLLILPPQLPSLATQHPHLNISFEDLQVVWPKLKSTAIHLDYSYRPNNHWFMQALEYFRTPHLNSTPATRATAPGLITLTSNTGLEITVEHHTITKI